MEEIIQRVSLIKEGVVEYKYPLFFGGISVICIVISVFFLLQAFVPDTSVTIQRGETTASGELKKGIIVDIGGGVINPGVYTIPEGSRISEAIEIAGGLSEQADAELVQKSINRAARVLDGSKLYIPTLSSTSHNNIAEQTIETITSHNSNKENKGESTISINAASLADLETLPGVGKVTAQKIIDNRPYLSLEELQQKKAVGKKLFEDIQSRISL